MQISQRVIKNDPQFYINQDKENIVRRFMHALTFAQHHTSPHDHWVLDRALPDNIADNITALPFAVQRKKDFSHAMHESSNACRLYFTPENQEQIEVCRTTADAFRDRRILELIEKITGKCVADGHLRIEYCQDTDGFRLEPHADSRGKLFSMIVHLSADPWLRDAGTDIYDSSPEHKLVTTIPYQKGRAMFFIPGPDTWHGSIRGVRKSLIINYVTPDWRDKWELT